VKKRERADVLLVEKGLAETRAKAQALLVAGKVYVGEVRIDKPGALVPREAELSLRGEDSRYVSRGGVKLRGALDAFAPHGLSPSGKVAVDIGASTGGFTDCLLQAGALRVYAVDVGHGLLHERLRSDPRVVVRERTNARELDAASFPEKIDLVVVDASFISLGVLAPSIAAVLPSGGELCAMIKPQFEAGRDEARKGRGVIRDEDVRRAAIDGATSAIVQHGFRVIATADAVLAGPKGNVEHFVYAERVTS
jgi:23S rRNA (cytidine1920-2'-O)/16S rRNA (cytidine1409-2'-O)-methyltransferase